MPYNVNKRNITTSDIGGVSYANVIILQNFGSGKPCIIFFSTMVECRPSTGFGNWTARPAGYANGYQPDSTGNRRFLWNNTPFLLPYIFTLFFYKIRINKGLKALSAAPYVPKVSRQVETVILTAYFFSTQKRLEARFCKASSRFSSSFAQSDHQDQNTN